ncbi:MAG: dTDP-4-dehydrorhamnose 3,5-epimerase [Hyphomonas sp.]|nr:dTDP-4-dehydrorhamnose 3,5-epimerase [Hyphomonas sp.]
MNFDISPDPVLPEVLIVRPKRLGDSRGWFSEIYNEAAFRGAGIDARFIQDNQSRSELAGTLRGLHFQSPPHAQAKLVRCTRGRMLDVIVDIRKGSPRFGRHTALELGEAEGTQVFVPEGFAHGFCTLEPGTEVTYKVSAGYAPGSDLGVAFDDPALGIAWPLPAAEMTLSDRDRKHPRLAELPDYFSQAFETTNKD